MAFCMGGSLDPLFLFVRDFIADEMLLPLGGGVIVGFSGGADSTCLLHILNLYINDPERLVAVHVNHMLRGGEAQRDEAHAERFCASLGVRFVCAREDAAAYAAERKMSVEAAARDVRYAAFERERLAMEAATGCAWRIAVAHNRDDLAETVLMNVLRGAGVDGLRGMGASAAYVVRPLLRVGRADVEAYLSKNGIGYVVDSTNVDIAFTRNRIRNELLPLLRGHYNPSVNDALCRLSDNAGRDADYLAGEALRAYGACATGGGRGAAPTVGVSPTVGLSISRFNVLHAAIAARVARLACTEAGADARRLEHVHISDIMELAASGRTGAELHLPGGLRVRRTYGVLVFAAPSATVVAPSAGCGCGRDARVPRETTAESGHGCVQGCGRDARVPAPPALPIGYVIKSLHKKDDEIVEQIKKIRYNSSEQLFDADSLCPDELELRFRRAGDTFFPINAPGSKKLKEFFIDAKIPGDVRSAVPLLAIGRDIAWVIGHRVGERYKVTDSTVNILRVRYIPG